MVDKPGAIVHVEFHSTDPERARSFYSKIFGWKFQEIPQMNYSTFAAPSGPGGGLQKHGEGGPMILDYILSKDINQTLRAIEENGGRTLHPKSEIPGYGWWAMFRDPTGLTMALYESKPQDRPTRRPRPARKRTARPKARRGKRGGRRSR